ncbi:MAG: IS481 family transposase [Acidobacteriia bacterium]|nr:IS481 family transposase [Terriglobia bacterium]
MPWKTMDVQEQRVRFVVAASRQEKPFTALCQEFGISRPTGMLWRERYQQAGLAGIAERSRRPQHSPRQTGWEWEQRVVEMRQRYPDWGARKLQVLLAREGVELTRSTVHRVLLRHDLVGAGARHRQALQRFERAAPNELWQMDFKSPKGWNAAIGPLSVLDDHSRYVVVLQAVWSTRAELVREQLISAFIRCGVPQAMLMDHGIPWWSTLAPGGATQLTLWLMKQGIELHWSGRRHPQTQGKVERFHGELERALQARGAPRKEPQAWLDGFRWEHNHVRPHEALGMQTPASRWRRSERVYDPQPPRWEYAAGAKVLKVDSSGKLWAWDKHWKISKALCGEWVQLERIGQRVLVYYCRTLIRELDLGNQHSTAVERWFPQSDAK